MKLQRGITGIWHVNDTPAPAIDFSFIKKNIYQIEDTEQYKITNFELVEPNNNYFKISIFSCSNKQNFNILFNAQYPYYCGISTDSDWMNLKFIELPNDIQNTLAYNFTYLNPQKLNRLVMDYDLSELSQAELKEIIFWNSKTLGEIIFNGYD